MREPLTLVLSEAPAALPLSLDEVKAQLRLSSDITEEDALLMGMLRSAVDRCEDFTGRALMTQAWTLFRDSWPQAEEPIAVEGLSVSPATSGIARSIELPKPPLQSVIHVKTYDDSDTATVWSSESYIVDTAREPGRIVVRRGQGIPLPGRAANGIEIRFVAGYGGAPADVPEQIRQGLMMLTAALYENRGDEIQGDRRTEDALRLWQPYRGLRL